MSNRIDSQIDDINALINEMELHQRRKRMEREFGPIKTVCNCPPIPWRGADWEAYVDNELDYDMPAWARAHGETEAKALETLLEQTEEKLAERLDAMRQDELERRAGCNEA